MCHQIGENAKNAVGPVLNGVIGRKAGSVPGYSYSDANKNSGITWDEATFREYIKDPRAKVPGTTESQPAIRRNPENEIASFRAFRPAKLAISNLAPVQKSTPAQWLGRFFTAACLTYR